MHVRFRSPFDFFSYLPRATVIAFLAPFPSHWFGEGHFSTTTLMRRVSAVEMVIVYGAFVLFLITLWRWWRRIELWVVILFCSGFLVIYGLVIANVGTLYRERYGFLMTLVALGIAGGVGGLQKFRKGSDKSRQDASPSQIDG